MPEDFIVWPHHIAFYEESLRSRVTSALNSVEVANSIIQTLPSEEPLSSDWRRVLLDEMQNIVIQSGAISKFFRHLEMERMNYIKNAVNFFKSYLILNQTPLKSRKVRDHIEHFDEKLDNYLYDPQKPVSGYIFPELVADIDDNEGTPHHIFRGYYLQTGIFQILNEQIEINSLVEEIVKISEKFRRKSEI